MIKKLWNYIRAVWRWFTRVMAWLGCFLNLLEPEVDFPVLSISKISMWATLICTCWIAVHNPTGSEIATALGAQLAATGNYIFRRKLQADNKLAGYKEATKEEDA
jgi:hypothetical protein